MELMVKDGKSIKVSEKIFGSKFNESLIHQLVTTYKNTARQGSHAQKNRSEVSGGGAKPWKQKGTGRARAGSIRSPIWRSGGVTFAAKPTSYRQKLNKKMYRGAMRSILSELIRQDRLIVTDDFIIHNIKTKSLLLKLNLMSLKNVLIVTDKVSDSLLLSARNLYDVKVTSSSNINPISLILFKKTLMTVDAVKKIEGMLDG